MSHHVAVVVNVIFFLSSKSPPNPCSATAQEANLIMGSDFRSMGDNGSEFVHAAYAALHNLLLLLLLLLLLTRDRAGAPAS